MSGDQAVNAVKCVESLGYPTNHTTRDTDPEMANQEPTNQERHEFAKDAAFGIGLPTAVMSFVYVILKRVETWGDFFTFLTAVQAVVLFVVNLGGCYLAGLVFWKLKRKLEEM